MLVYNDPRMIKRWLLLPWIDTLSDEALRRLQAKLDTVRTVFGAFALASVLGAGVGLRFQDSTLKENQQRDQQEINRRIPEDEHTQKREQDEIDRRIEEYAQTIIDGWDQRTSDVKGAIDGFLTKLHPNMVNPDVDKETAIKIWFAVNNESDLGNMRQKIRSLLNYFESVSTAYEKKTGNQEILEEAMSGPMMNWRDRLKYYTALADCVRGYPVWAPYYRVTDKWIANENKKHGLAGRLANYVPLADLSNACLGDEKGKIPICSQAALRRLP
jgi:hypothetical protein